MKKCPLSLLVVGTILVLGCAALANSPPPQEGSQFRTGGGAQDLLNSTQLLGTQQSGLTISLTCTDANGKNIGKGEDGYLECLDAMKRNGQLPQTGSASNAAGVNFKIK